MRFVLSLGLIRSIVVLFTYGFLTGIGVAAPVASPAMRDVSAVSLWGSAMEAMPKVLEQRRAGGAAPGFAAAEGTEFAALLRRFTDDLVRLRMVGPSNTEVAMDLNYTYRRLRNARQEVERALVRIERRLQRMGLHQRLDRVSRLRAIIDQRTQAMEALLKDLETAPGDVDLERLGRIISTLRAPAPPAPKPSERAVPKVRQISPASALARPDVASAILPAALAPPAPGDLAETPEIQFTPAIQALAAALDHSPVKLYEWVRNQVDFEVYYGSLKGAEGVLQTGRGNDYDQASLLLALLRVSGIPARYQRGTAQMPVSRVLQWLDLSDPEAANPLLNTAGIEAIPIVDGDGKIVSYRIDRVWVVAYAPIGNYRGAVDSGSERAWVPLDPAFTQSDLRPGIDTIGESVAFDEDEYLNQVRTQLPADFYTRDVESYLNANLPGVSLADIPHDGPVVPEAFGLLPASTPFRLYTLAGDFDEVAENLRHRVRVSLYADSGPLLLETTLRQVETNSQRKSISFVPATATDQAIVDSFGGLAHTPPFLVDVKPQLKLDGVLAVEGGAVGLGARLSLDVGFVDPDAGETDSVDHSFIAGTYVVLNLDAGQTSNELLDKRAARLLEATTNIGTPAEDADELTGELLNIGGLLYWQRLREYDGKVLGLFHYKPAYGVSESVTMSDLDVLYLFDRPFAVTPGSLRLDAARLQLSTFNIDDDPGNPNALRRLLGFNSSSLEHAMWEELVAVESISTIKALQVASEAGYPLHEFDASSSTLPITCSADGSTDDVLGCMQKCGVSAFTLSAIVDELAGGKLVKTHECPITLNQWDGLGYISVDASTQVGAYIISGGLNAVQPTGAETTMVGPPPVFKLEADIGRMLLSGLPTHTLDNDNLYEELARLPLPKALKGLLQGIVDVHTEVVVADVVVMVDGRESLVFRVDGEGAAGSEFFAFDTVLGGGSGTENPPSPIQEILAKLGVPPDIIAAIGDPVTVVSGNLWLRAEDVTPPKRGIPFALVRTYNSRSTMDGPFGVGWTHNYNVFVSENPDGSVTFTDETGGELLYVSDGQGGFISPPGTYAELSEQSGVYRLRKKAGITYDFDIAGKLIAITNRNHNRLDFSYHPSGLLATVTDTIGRQLSFGYNLLDKIETVVDYAGRTWTYEYDQNGDLLSFSTPSDGQTPVARTTYSYYQSGLLAHNLASVTDPEGNRQDFLYYANDRIFQTRIPTLTKADGSVGPGPATSLYYDLLNRRTRVIDYRGLERVYHYDENGYIVQIDFSDGTNTKMEWVDGRRLSLTDELGNRTNFVTDTSGNLLETIDPLGNSTLMTYEPVFNQLTSITDPARHAPLQINHDADGNPVQMVDPMGTIWEMEMDDPVRNPSPVKGRLTKLVNAKGIVGVESVVTMAYDAAGNLVRVTGPLGGYIAMQYDAKGNMVQTTNGEGQSVRYEYDLLDRMILAVHAPGTAAEERTSYVYDGKTNLVRVIDAAQRTTEFTYDELNRLVKVRNPIGLTETFEYDGNDNLIAWTKYSGQTLRYLYDSRDRLSRKTLPDGQESTYGFDAVGRLVSMLNPESRVTISYDADGRPHTVSTSGSPYQPDTTLTYDYDVNGNRLKLTDVTGITRYTYDDVDRLSSVVTPSGDTVSYSYNPLGRTTEVLYSNGVRTTMSYDLAGQLAELVNRKGATVISRFDYSYDDAGNIQRNTLARSIFPAAASPLNYAYDALGQLVQATHPLAGQPVQVYSYDNVRNRTDICPVANCYDNANRLLEDFGYRYSYDDNGNLVSRTVKGSEEVTLFVFDAESRLKQIRLPSSTVSYKYDGLGRRVAKVLDGVVAETYVWDGSDLLLIGDTDKNIAARITYGDSIDEPLVMERGGLHLFYQKDGLGSITELSNSTGAIVQGYLYDAYGRIVDSVAPIGSLGNSYAFTAREYEPESALYQYRARYYDPTTGRFISADPYGFFQGLNFYTYVGNNPVNLTDPSGLYIESAIDAGAIAIDVYFISQHDENTSTFIKVIDYASLGIDSVALALPFVPGVVGYLRGGTTIAAKATIIPGKVGGVFRIGEIAGDISTVREPLWIGLENLGKTKTLEGGKKVFDNIFHLGFHKEFGPHFAVLSKHIDLTWRKWYRWAMKSPQFGAHTMEHWSSLWPGLLGLKQ